MLAHIRHCYTDYDKLLRTKPYLEARADVEPVSRDQLIKWRGENDSGQIETEDVFREVLVIDDTDSELSDALSIGHASEYDFSTSLMQTRASRSPGTSTWPRDDGLSPGLDPWGANVAYASSNDSKVGYYAKDQLDQQIDQSSPLIRSHNPGTFIASTMHNRTPRSALIRRPNPQNGSTLGKAYQERFLSRYPQQRVFKSRLGVPSPSCRPSTLLDHSAEVGSPDPSLFRCNLPPFRATNQANRL